MQNKVTTIEKVIAEHCFTGMSVLLPGFVNVGVAESLIDGLLETDITDPSGSVFFLSNEF